MAFLLDALHEDLNRIREPKHRATGSRSVLCDKVQKAEERIAAEAWYDHLQRHRSLVVDLCQGQLRSQVKCCECGCASVTFDPFLFLTLPLPPQLKRGRTVHIQEAIKAFCVEEKLQGEDCWGCPRCDRRAIFSAFCAPSSERPRAESRPNKRPSSGSEAGWGAPTWKIEGEVWTPGRLDLQDFVSEMSPQRVSLQYDLFAAVDHAGVSPFSGHYTASCLRPDGWWRFDDSRAEYLGRAGAEATEKKVIGPWNYLLLFQRRDAPLEPEQIPEQKSSEASETWRNCYKANQRRKLSPIRAQLDHLVPRGQTRASATAMCRCDLSLFDRADQANLTHFSERIADTAVKLGRSQHILGTSLEEEHNKIWQQLAVYRPTIQALNENTVEMPRAGEHEAGPASLPRLRRPSHSAPVPRPPEIERLSSGLAAISDDCEENDDGSTYQVSPHAPTAPAIAVESPATRHVKIGAVQEFSPNGRQSQAGAAPSISLELNDRLAKIFMVEEQDAKVVTAPELVTVMQRKRDSILGCGDYTKERMEDVIREMRTIAGRLRGESPKRSQQQTVISWRSFVECMSIPDLAAQARVEMAEEIFRDTGNHHNLRCSMCTLRFAIRAFSRVAMRCSS
eukprot:g12187.t1